MTPLAIVDSSFLRVLYDKTQPRYAEVAAAAEARAVSLVIPDVVLTETAFLFRRDAGVIGVLRFLDTLRTVRPQLEPVRHADLTRARDIMAQYLDARFDFVDCCLMALAERLAITQVCTLDRRDFTIFRPAHVDVLEILP